MNVRKFFILHLLPPRPYFWRKRWFSDHPDAHGRLHADHYVAHPWYIKPTFKRRYGLKALFLRLVGGVLPGDNGTTYLPHGYIIPEIGPDALRGKGNHEMEQSRQRLSRNDRVGCPFAKW